MTQNSQLAYYVDNLLQGRNVAEANSFIQQYSETKECWFEALNLLEGHSVNVQFFVATIIHTKVSCCACPTAHCP